MPERAVLRPTLSAPDKERYVALATEGGVIVYPASNPKDTNTVQGTPEDPSCTCASFLESDAEDFRCLHISTVFGQAVPRRPTLVSPPASPNRENAPAPAAMVLKRSVSPDGRIDSLSVEFSVPLSDLSGVEISSKAASSLALQGQITEQFLGSTRRSTTPAKAPQPVTKVTAAPLPPPAARPILTLTPRVPSTPNVPSLAQQGTITYLGSAESRYGKRLFLSIEVDGERYRFFGSRRKILDALTLVGSPVPAEDLHERMSLDIPCRVTLEETPDGRYTNVTGIFPPERQAA